MNSEDYENLSPRQLNEKFVDACWIGNVELVQYLLTSPELKIHPDIHYENDRAFIYATQWERELVLNYLIFDYKMTINSGLNLWLKENIDEKPIFSFILQKIKSRDLNLKLNKILSDISRDEKKVKL